MADVFYSNKVDSSDPNLPLIAISGDTYNSTAGGYQIGGDYNREARANFTFPSPETSTSVQKAYPIYEMEVSNNYFFTFVLYCSVGSPWQWDDGYAINVSINGSSLEITNEISAEACESLGSSKYEFKLSELGTFNPGDEIELTLNCDENGEYPISQYQRPVYLVAAGIHAKGIDCLTHNGNPLYWLEFTAANNPQSGTYYRKGDPLQWQSPDIYYKVTLPPVQQGVQYYTATQHLFYVKNGG